MGHGKYAPKHLPEGGKKLYKFHLGDRYFRVHCLRASGNSKTKQNKTKSNSVVRLDLSVCFKNVSYFAPFVILFNIGVGSSNCRAAALQNKEIPYRMHDFNEIFGTKCKMFEKIDTEIIWLTVSESCIGGSLYTLVTWSTLDNGMQKHKHTPRNNK